MHCCAWTKIDLTCYIYFFRLINLQKNKLQVKIIANYRENNEHRKEPFYYGSILILGTRLEKNYTRNWEAVVILIVW